MSKIKDERDKLNNMNVDQLNEKVIEFRKELFTLQLNTIAGQVKDYSQINKLRKNIARALTTLRQKQLQA